MTSAESRSTAGGRGKPLSGKDARLHPVTAITDVLFDQRLRPGLLRRNAATFGAQRDRAAALQGEHPLELARDLLRIVATEREQHIRNGALVLLELVPYDLIPRPQLRATYIGSVRAVDLDPDNTGNIGGLLRAGQMLAPHFEEFATGEVIGDRRRSIARPWMDIATRSGDEDIWRTIAVGVYAIQNGMSSSPVTPEEEMRRTRRIKILELCSPGMLRRELELTVATELLVDEGIIVRPGFLSDDMKYFADHGIAVLHASDNRRGRK